MATSNSDSQRLEARVATEAYEWGDNVADAYHGLAAQHMDVQWAAFIQPFLDTYKFNLERVADFAAGFGRNTRKLLAAGAQHVTMIDVNPDCVRHLESAFRGTPTRIIMNNGRDLSDIPDDAFSFIYSFDAVVHFDMEVVISYIYEMHRTVQRGGHVLIHHSNYSSAPGRDFRQNPHFRNFMSAEIFSHVAQKAGFAVVEQRLMAWELPDLDCITLLQRT